MSSQQNSTSKFKTSALKALTSKTGSLEWTEIILPRLQPDDALMLLVHMASIDRRGPLVWEVRARAGRIHYLLGAEPSTKRRLLALISTELPGTRFKACRPRTPIPLVRRVKLSHPTLALNTKATLAIVRATLASLAITKQHGDETCLQIIMNRSFTPSLLPKQLNDPSASWLDNILGSVGPVSSESRISIAERASHHGFEVAIHIGARSNSEGRAVENARAVFSGLKVAEAIGVRMNAVSAPTTAIDEVKIPWRFTPMRLSVKELAGIMCLPLSDMDLPGVAGIHPRVIIPPDWYKAVSKGMNPSQSRIFGTCVDGEVKLGIPPRDALFHTLLIGPTGSGKSVCMLNMIMVDIEVGRSVLVIDPKSDLINDILARIPESREKDVVVLDPTSPSPVGWNPLSGSGKNPTLTADAILSIFEQVFSDSFGTYSMEILSGALLTLASVKGASLAWLPALLTNDNFRHKVLQSMTSYDQGIASFWEGYEALTPSARAHKIASVMNKLQRFLLRPELRNMLSQSNPKFDLQDMFYGRRIVLVPLNKSLTGHETARLLGSLVVAKLWELALSRTEIEPHKRHIVSVYLDEAQNFISSISSDLSDALAQARGLGVSICAAHQHRDQIPPDVRSAFDSNILNKIAFGMSASDASDFAKMAPELSAEDFMLLPRFGIYTNLLHNGKSTGWMSGKTLPAKPAIRSAHEVKAISAATYGRDAKEVEAEYLAALGYTNTNAFNEVPNISGEILQEEQVGRKKRSSNSDKEESKDSSEQEKGSGDV